MTSLAVRSIAMALKCKNNFGFSTDETYALEEAVSKGFEYIKKHEVKKNAEVYWCFTDNKKSCAATTWALLALRELKDLSLNDEITNYYSDVIKDGKNSIINSLPKSISRWADEPVVIEAGAKYGSMKNYYSFSPTLIMDFMDLGISPYNIRIVNQIRWLLNNEKEWKIDKYDTQYICSFTYAMVMATVVKWVSLVGAENSKKICSTLNKANGVSELLLGFSWLNDSPIQIFNKARVLWNFVFLILIIIFFLKSSRIIGLIKNLLFKYLIKGEDVNSIRINIISSILCYLGGLVVLYLFRKIQSIFIRRS